MVKVPQWNVKVSKALDEAVNNVVKAGRYSSKAEFIRSAVREKLDSMGYKNSRVK